MKTLFKTALILLVGGIVISAVAFAFVKFDFNTLSSEDLVTNTYYVDDAFSNIEIDGSDCKVTLLPSEDGKCKAVCTETEKITFDVRVENGTLKIVQHDDRSWKNRIGIFIAEKGVDLYLPVKEFETLKVNNSSGSVVIYEGLTFSEIDTEVSSGSVKCSADADILSVKTSSGSIKLDGVLASAITLKASSGSIQVMSSEADNDITVKTTSGSISLDSVNCENLTVSASSGSVRLADVIAVNALKAETSSGSVNFDRSDAAVIEVETSSGSVKGTLLSDKIFVTDTSSGSVDVPASFEGGKCYIKTSSGSIKIKIASSD